MNSKIEIGKIIKNGLFYRLETETKTEFIKNGTFYSVLSGDVIKYIRKPEGVLIMEIIDRTPVKTLGLVYQNKIRLPFLSENFIVPIPRTENPDIVKAYLVLVDKNGANFLEDLGSVFNSSQDIERACKIYKGTSSSEAWENLHKNSSTGVSHYTRDGVIDLRHLDTFNIDPTGSKDFDDAISVDVVNNKVYIHIVDIVHHLLDKPDDEKRAFELGYTLYLPERNTNMFSEEYSENLFSLRKGEDRHTITTEITFDKGKMIKYDIYRSIIQIKTRYDYQTAEEALNNGEESLGYLSNLLDNNDGMLTYSKLDIPNRKLVLDEFHIRDIKLEYHNRCNRIIEAFMVATNKILTEHLIQIPQRYHPRSDAENPDSLLSVYDSIELIRKYKLAKYSVNDKGHYGLSLDKYTHFTSPIRRGLDILVHKILGGVVYNSKDLEKMIEYLNEREKLNEQIINFYETCKIFEYMMTIRKDFSARIMNVTKFGVQIMIEDLLYNDFVHIANIDKNTRWVFDAENKKLVDSLNNTRMICKNNRINVSILKIDWFRQKIEYILSV